jgi:2,3-bisphosphoglycerate-dependent phosphoglycerate mutase
MYSPNAIVSSTEIKAQETAQIVASHLKLPMKTHEGLHEHERSNYHWVSQELFEKQVAAFYFYPQKLVMGNETAEQTSTRFACAVDRVVEEYHGKNVAIVTHGTVIALYISRHLKVDAFPFWKHLGLPSYVVLSFPEMKLCKVKFSL